MASPEPSAGTCRKGVEKMTDEEFPRVEIENVSGGLLYRAKGRTAGPFSSEQQLNPDLEVEIAEKLGVPAKAIFAAKLMLHTFTSTSEDAPPIVETHREYFDENTPPHVIARSVLVDNKILTMSDDEEMMDYDPRTGVFRAGAEVRIKKTLEHTFRKLEIEKALKTNVLREALEHIKRRTYTDREQLNKDPFLLNVRNGILDLRTFTLLPHDPSYKSTVQLQVDYNPEATCPDIMKFLHEVLYEDDIHAVQELLGYVLWRGYPAAKAWMLVGTGGNGKSTFIALVKALLGLDNVSSRGLVDLERNRFATAELYGKLANLYADLEDVALRTTGKFKMLTGKDPVTAEFKFRMGFSFVNFAKLIFSCNKIPEAVDDTDAFFRRWVIICFPNQFLGDKEDRNLLEKLTTPEELSGLLNLALVGLKRLQDNGWRFSNTKTTEEIRLEYIRKSSPVKAFLMDSCKPDVEGLVPKSELFSKFSEYCHLHKLPVLSSDAFFKKLPEVNPNLSKFYGEIPNGPARADGKPMRVHCVKGLVLLPPDEWGRLDQDEDGDAENNSGESPAHVAHPAPGTLDAHLDSNPVQPVQGVQGSGHCYPTELDPLGSQEGREAALGYLNTWCKKLDLNLLAQELVSAGYTRSLAVAERFVKELAERGILPH